MVKIESGCVDCGLPCLYNSCPYYKRIAYECDSCGEESKLYWFDNCQLCIDCITERLEEVCCDEIDEES